MIVEPLDTLIAYKAISIMPGLTAAERRVAGAIIDHFNRDNGRCDPGVERLVELLDLDRRTVLRAVDALDRQGLILKNRHGGQSLRNSYAPVWARFREIDAGWRKRFSERSDGRTMAAPPLHGRQRCHLAGGADVTQTSPRNQSKEPVDDGANGHRAGPAGDWQKRGSARQEKEELAPASPVPPVRRGRGMASLEAALAAAERRWGGALLNALPPAGYVAAVEAIDDGLRAEATAAELKRHGAGLALITERLGLHRPDETAADLHGSSQGPHPLAVVSDPEATSVRMPKTRVMGGYGGYGGYGPDGGSGGDVSTARSEPVNEDRESSRTSHARPLTTEHLVAREDETAPEAPPVLGGDHA